MARFAGNVGFVMPVETDPVNRPGIWENQVTERPYRGDVLTRRVRISDSDSMAGNLSLSNEISIVADNFAKENLGYMCYIVLKGSKWAVTSADVGQYPRIILSLGGLWNEQTA